MRLPGGHLGGLVSALVDGQLDPAPAERAWAHVAACGSCRAAVETETWLKSRLSSLQATDAPAALADAIARSALSGGGEERVRVAAAWAAAAGLERRDRVKRAGLAAAGAGSLSAAVIGLGALSGSLDIAEPRPPGAVIGKPPSAPLLPPPAEGRDRLPDPTISQPVQGP